MSRQPGRVTTSPESANPELLALLRRVRADYREMPGLMLTREQMQRLWGIDALLCDVVVKTLVDAQGGTVAAEFPPDGGTVFELSFPVVG